MASSIAATAPWLTRPVFISSTFKDMQSERDYLRHVVFPRLEEELRKSRLQLEPIDLRQGVETAELASEEGCEQVVLKVCLEEIQRSRPFLIVLLGDRYGWVPPEERMRAAIDEAGIRTDLRDKSVTALEIEFGILQQSPEQRRRSFFYFREPLPYHAMAPEQAAEFSDQYPPIPFARTRSFRLQALRKRNQLLQLKLRLQSDPELASRIHNYRAVWDADAGKLTGLEVWGEMVFQHLVEELQEEIQAAATQPPQTWEDQERAALAEFIEQRRRDFTGRQQLLDDLTSLARSPAPPDAVWAIPAGVTWGACLTGDPGSGKSAIFAELVTKLSSDRSLLLLTNAAGATPRGSQVEAMLERFIQELADALRIANPLPEKATSDDVDATFASLLSRAAVNRRVVVLLDALNQFDPTPRAQHLTWLRPKLWPANARLIATALPSSSADALSRLTGIVKRDVQPLTITGDDTDDVTAIARCVWQRYHRQFNTAVVRVFKSKRLPDQSHAAGNPLWLTLALEQIQLLDADDFARAERDFAHLPAHERVTALLIDTAERMPPSVPELYQSLLGQSEKLFGPAAARAFAAVIAISRFGWRESDLLALIPAAARVLCPDEPVPELNDLRLAILRRSFRSHLVRRGAREQLDFFHAQMRRSVEQRVLTNPQRTLALHRAIADHLESLPNDNVLRLSERMFHLIAGDDPGKAARAYSEIPDSWQKTMSGAISKTWSELEVPPDTSTLADHITRCDKARSKRNAEWVASLMSQSGLTSQQQSNLVVRVELDLGRLLIRTADLETRRLFSSAALEALRRLLASDPKPGWQFQLSLSLQNLGDLAMALQDLNEAKRCYSESRDIQKRFLQAIPLSAGAAALALQETYAVALGKLGNVAVAEKNFSEARQLYSEALRIDRTLVQSNPRNPEFLNHYAIALQQLGNVDVQTGHIDSAERLYLEMHQAAAALVKGFPGTSLWKETLALACFKLGNVNLNKGQTAKAQTYYLNACGWYEQLSQSDPDNSAVERDRAKSQANLGLVAKREGRLADARNLYQQAHRTLNRLVAADPGNVELQDALTATLNDLSNLTQA